MDYVLGFELARIARKRKEPRKIIDWMKVFEILNTIDIKNAEVGLKEDFNETKGLLVKNGELLYPLEDTSEYGIYLGSVWATPILKDLDTGIEWPCYKEVDYDSPEFFTEDYRAVLDKSVYDINKLKE